MAEKTRLQIELVLPEVHDADDRCVQRLTDLLAAKKGVGRVHLDVSEQEAGKICVHFDSSIITVGEIRQFAMQAGVDLAKRYGHILVEIRTVTARHARQIAVTLETVPGVLDAGVSPDGIVRVEFDRKQTNEAEVRRNINELAEVGRQKEPASAGSHDHHGGNCEHHHGGILGENSELIFAILCGLSLVVGWLISITTEWSASIPLVCYVLAYVFGGFFIVQEAIQKTLMGRFEIDFLMIVAAIGAAVLGEWAEGALLLFLFSIGHALEHFAMRRARTAIESLADLAPRTAFVKRKDTFLEVPVEQLIIGDTVLVKTNEKIAADGFVIVGNSSVDQSPITGESVPVDKRPVDDRQKSSRFPKLVSPESSVYAGTLNQSGAMEIEVTKLAKDTTLARVVTMVSEAETQTSPTQRFTDRFERYFVPLVIAVVALLHLAFLVIDESFADSFYRAMAVLVAASPCALAISTPSAVLSGIACAARGGVLIKGGGPLENLGQLDAIAFDKTG
ncbi:MAG: heavy metal translocating P-type ATPase, partial [Pirellulaceae bacterium]|nr:heavy metal translocating P-type ATPase [Pirellulaceae bacterium]